MKTIAIECRSIEDKQWGVGRSVAKLLEELARNPELAEGYRFILLFHRKIPNYPYLDSPLFKKYILCPGRLRVIPFFIYYFIFVPLTTLWLAVDATYYPNYMLPILHLGKSIVVLTEDVYNAIRDPEMGTIHRIAYGVFSWWASIRATMVMTVSNSSQKEVGRLFHIAPERLFANPHGVNLSPYNRTDQKRDPNLFVYVGQAFPRRHLRETMRAFDVLAESNRSIHLRAIGVDKYPGNPLKQLVEDINQKHRRNVINYTDYVTDQELVNLYQSAQGCIYISFDEAFGLPPVEATSLGCISIIADTGVAHEIFRESAIFIKDSHNVSAIVNGVKKALMTNLEAPSLKHDQERIQKTYTWQAHAQRFISAISQI